MDILLSLVETNNLNLMTNETTKPPIWYWIAGVIALLWNAMGVNAYLDQAYMTPEKLATLPEAQQAMYSIEYPAWVTAAFAIAVFGGTIGSLLLLLRKNLAYIVLLFSLIGVIFQMSYAFANNDTDSYGPGGIIMPIMIIIIAIALVFLARKAKSNNWTR